ncbi:MAG: L-alanine exporter AlaE [Pseudomonadota bacterium]
MTLSPDVGKHRRPETDGTARHRLVRAAPNTRALWLVDTLAVLSFFTLVGGLNEWIVVGMSPSEVLVTRLAAIPILLISGAVYGAWRDVFHRLTHFHNRTGLGRMVIDTCACLAFRVPIYGMILLLGGAQGSAFLYGLLTGSIIIAVSGRPCGIWIDILRRLFRCTPRTGAQFLARSG